MGSLLVLDSAVNGYILSRVRHEMGKKSDQMKTESWETRFGNLEKSHGDTVPRLVRIEERFASLVSGLKIAGFVLLGLLSWGGTQLYILNGNVSRLGGQVSSLTPRALSDLFTNATENKENIARNAQLAAVLVSSARQSSLRSNKKELAISSAQLSQLVTRHSDVPELWQASAQLASYRSELENTLPANLPDCRDTTPIQKSNLGELVSKTADYSDTKITPYVYANCKQNMDDFNELIKKNPHMEYKSPTGQITLMTASYIFQSSLIIYNGDRLLPDTVLEFKNCVFQLELKREPGDRSQKLVLALLSSDLKDVSLPKI
jgi:hypothetical protein